MSKDMFVNYTDTKADTKGIKNGTFIKLIKVLLNFFELNKQ